MPAVLSYARTDVRAPNTGHRIRLQAQVDTPVVARDAFNLFHPQGLYARVYTNLGNLWFSRSDRPHPPFDLSAAATTTGDVAEGRFAWDPRGYLRLIYTRAGLGIYVKRGHAYGSSWAGEQLFRAGATHPDLVRDLSSGLLLYSYYDGGSLYVRRQETGEGTAAAEFVAADETAAPLAVADDTHRIAQDHRGIWWLHYRPGASGNTSLRFSADAGATWTPTFGAVSGITGGRFPGLAPLHSGGLVAWALEGGDTLYTTRLLPGETAWSTPVIAVDDAAAPLVFANASPSLAQTAEPPGRLWLSAVPTGAIFPREHHSADLGVSFKAMFILTP